jgi:hypothetical protein
MAKRKRHLRQPRATAAGASASSKSLKQSEVEEEEAFLADVTRVVAQRRKETDEWRKAQAEIDRIQVIADRIYESLKAVSASAPGDPSQPITPESPFDTMPWAAQVVEAARLWNEYHAVFSRRPRPRVSDQYGHESGRLIFACACRTLDPATVAQLTDRLVAQVSQIGRTAYIVRDRFHESAYGIQDYFIVLAWDFARSGGEVWKYDGGVLPGRITVTPQGRARAPATHHPSDPAEDDTTGTTTSATSDPAQPDPEIDSSSAQSPFKVSEVFVTLIMKEVPRDGSWIHRDELILRAKFKPGGRYYQALAFMAGSLGLLESHTKKGYRLPQPSKRE